MRTRELTILGATALMLLASPVRAQTGQDETGGQNQGQGYQNQGQGYQNQGQGYQNQGQGYQNQPYQQPGYGKDAMQGTHSFQKTQLKGQILRQKDVRIQGSDTMNRVVQVRTTNGELIAVDLGPVTKIETQNIKPGQTITASGEVARVGDRPVLFAQKFTLGTQSFPEKFTGKRAFNVDRSQDLGQYKEKSAAQLRTAAPPTSYNIPTQVNGQVIREKDVGIKGLDRTNKVVMIKTDQGQDIVADLGLSEPLRGMTFSPGDSISVSGKPVRIGDRLVLLADRVASKGKSVRAQHPKAAAGYTETVPGTSGQQGSGGMQSPGSSEYESPSGGTDTAQ